MKRSTTSPVPAPARKAWRALLAAAGQTLGRRALLMRHQAVVLPRFAACYGQIAALPRAVQRRLLRRARLTMAGLAFLCAIGQAPAFAATITVNATCTLTDAIFAANTDAPSGGCAAGSGADTIVLPSNTTFLLTAPYPTITSDITIEGNGSTLARPTVALPLNIRMSHGVGQVGHVILNNLTVQGGGGVDGPSIYAVVSDYRSTVEVTLNHSRILNSTSGGLGVSGGSATLNHSTVSGNNGGPALSAAVVTVNDSIISDNHSGGIGGGIQANGPCTVTNSTIAGNSALQGGGIFAPGCTITGSTLSGNSAAGDGGGVNFFGTVAASIANSTISGNSAARGGGVFRNGRFFFSDMVSLTDSTVANNTASSIGGGIYNQLTVMTLARTIVSGNSAPTGREVYRDPAWSGHYNYDTGVYETFTGDVVLNDFNLIGQSGNAGADGLPLTLGPTDVVPMQPIASILGPLAANGGATMTHALVAGSRAVDVVPISDCAATDQRGVSRPQGPACDIGAFERVPSPSGFAFTGFFPPVANHTSNGVNSGRAIPVRFGLGGNKGLAIFEGGYPATQQIACDLSGGTSPVTETTNAGNSSLSYDVATDTYVFVWKTEKAWANSCRRLLLRFTDGSTASADFRFTK